MVNSLKQTQQKGFKRRWLYGGWDNWTDHEREYVQKVKDMMLEKYKIDLNKKKGYGPRTAHGYFVLKENPIDVSQGTDPDFTDEDVLRFLQGFHWDLPALTNDMLTHLEWR